MRLNKIPLFGVVFAILLIVVFFCDVNFSLSKEGWITITFLAMMQFSVGTWIRQTLQRSITMIAALVLINLIQYYFPFYADTIIMVLSITFAFVCVFVLEIKYVPECLVFSFIFLFANFMPLKATFNEQVVDVLIATVLMLFISSIITLVTIKRAFIKLALKSVDYMIDLVKEIKNFHYANCASLFSLNEALQEEGSWVFSFGLSPGLRGGFRYFQLEIENAIELLYQISSKAHLIEDDENLSLSFKVMMETNTLLLGNLRHFFLGQSFVADQNDYLQDMRKFENEIQKGSPNVSSIYLSENELNLISLLKASKDFRQVLLRLILALPKSIN